MTSYLIVAGTVLSIIIGLITIYQFLKGQTEKEATVKRKARLLAIAKGYDLGVADVRSYLAVAVTPVQWTQEMVDRFETRSMNIRNGNIDDGGVS